MQHTARNFKNPRGVGAAPGEALAWLDRQQGWERRLGELRRPRPAGRLIPVVRRPAA